MFIGAGVAAAWAVTGVALGRRQKRLEATGSAS
jgi:ATP:ADP antiporter, AAA family